MDSSPDQTIMSQLPVEVVQYLDSLQSTNIRLVADNQYLSKRVEFLQGQLAEYGREEKGVEVLPEPSFAPMDLVEVKVKVLEPGFQWWIKAKTGFPVPGSESWRDTRAEVFVSGDQLWFESMWGEVLLANNLPFPHKARLSRIADLLFNHCGIVLPKKFWKKP